MSIADNYHAVCALLQKKLPHTAQLLAVSKNQSVDSIRVLLNLGHRHFAENRVQEAQEKWLPLMKEYPDVTLHLIGQLQSNKAEEAADLFHVIHTVDRISLVEKLKKLSRCPALLVQVNTGEEPQKGGVLPADLSTLMAKTSALPVKGLMCIPPVHDIPAPHFAFLKKLAQPYGLSELSMGMSNDWQTAVALGATYIRLGTALFGERA